MRDLGSYQTPWVRIQRLLNAQQEGLKALTQVTADSIDLEARRRVSERPPTPPVSEWMPQRDEAAALQPQMPRPVTPTATPTPPMGTTLPQLYEEGRRPLAPGEQFIEPPAQEPRQGLLGRGLGLVGQGLEAAARPAYEYGVKPVMRGVQYVEEPVAAAALGAVSRAGPLGGPALGPGQQIGETPMERAPIGEELVNPVSAWLGDEEEQRKAREVLDEAGLPAEMMAYFFTSPLNLLPVVGFTSGRGFLNTLRQATRVTGKAREAIIARPAFRRTVEAIASEAGGPRVPGVGPEDVARVTPPESPVDKFTRLIRAAKKPRAETEMLKHEELQRRAGAVGGILEHGKGTPEQRLIQAKGQLKGELPQAAFEPIRPSFTEGEVQSLIDQALTFDFGPNRALTQMRAGELTTGVLLGKLPTRGEITLLEQVFGSGLARALLTKRPLSARAWENFVDLLNLPRTVLASLDHSFPGRQGLKLAPRHPREWASSFVAGAKALARENVARSVDDALRTDATSIAVRVGDDVRHYPYHQVKEMSGLYHAPWGEAAALAQREEAFISHWARLIPGIKMSERAYITSGNKIRSDVLERLLLNSMKPGAEPLDLETIKGLANFLNRVSGRGTLGPAEQLAPVLSGLQFAPRYRLGGPQAFANLLHSNPRVRREAAETLVAFVSSGIGILTLLDLSGGAEVELSPFSSDWGKVRIGKTRFDFWGGSQQQARAVAQLIMGRRTTSTGETISAGRQDAAWRYFRTGMSPVAGFVTDVELGETMIGEELEATSEGIRTQAFNRLTPMAWQDIIDSVREEGVRGAFFTPLPLLGIGTQAYETPGQAFERKTGRDWTETPPMLRREIVREDPELAAIFESRNIAPGDEIRAMRGAELLPGAKAVLQGIEDAGEIYNENRSSIMTKFSGVAEEAFRDLNIKPKGRDNELLEDYYSVDFMEDRNKNGIPGDDEDVKLAIVEREGILADMSAPVRKAIENPANFFPDPEVVQVEEMRNRGIEQMKAVQEMSRFPGLSAEDGDAIVDLTREGGFVEETRAELIRRGMSEDELPSAFDILVRQMGILREEGDDEGARIHLYAALRQRPTAAREFVQRLVAEGKRKEAEIIAGLHVGNAERDQLIAESEELRLFWPGFARALSEVERANLEPAGPPAFTPMEPAIAPVATQSVQ